MEYSSWEQLLFFILTIEVSFLVMHVPVMLAYYKYVSLSTGVLISFLLLSVLLFTGVIERGGNGKSQNNISVEEFSKREKEIYKNIDDLRKKLDER